MNLSENPPHLRLRVQHSIGAIALDVAFDLTQPWTVLFGPSGSGKTTILRMIAGLVRPQQGRVLLRRASSSHAQLATETATGTFVPPHRRWVRWSAQSPALFPHLTVRENLRFAVDAARADSADIVAEALQRFQLTPLAEKKPAALSGGERQRISVARAATAADGRLLMLDEPFSGLDARLRDELLEDLRCWLRLVQTPVLSVTHDVGEAFQLGADVIKLEGGRIQAHGPVDVVLVEERSRLIAQLNEGH